MEKVRSKGIGLMLTSYKSGAIFTDVLKQICRVAAAYIGFALAGAVALILSYLLAGWFSGFLLAVMGAITCLCLFVLVGVFVAYIDPELNSLFFSNQQQAQEDKNTHNSRAAGQIKSE